MCRPLEHLSGKGESRLQRTGGWATGDAGSVSGRSRLQGYVPVAIEADSHVGARLRGATEAGCSCVARVLVIGPIRDNGSIVRFRVKGLLSSSDAGKHSIKWPKVEKSGQVVTKATVKDRREHFTDTNWLQKGPFYLPAVH